MKVLVDEMYPAAVAEALRAAAIEATTVANLRLAGATDPEVFGAAVAGKFAVLTENVGDFAQIAAEHSTAGGHHNGLLAALSSRFSRRLAGLRPLVAAVEAIAGEQIEDRVIYLGRVESEWLPLPAVRAERVSQRGVGQMRVCCRERRAVVTVSYSPTLLKVCPSMGVLTRPLYQLAIAGSRLDRMSTRRAS